MFLRSYVQRCLFVATTNTSAVTSIFKTIKYDNFEFCFSLFARNEKNLAISESARIRNELLRLFSIHTTKQN